MPTSLVVFSAFVLLVGLAMLWVATQRGARLRTPPAELPSDKIRAIDDFLAQRRIAFVGLSHEEGDFSHALLKELEQRGYEVLAVNPFVDHIGDRTVWSRVQALPGKVDAALVMTPQAASAEVVQDCIDAGIGRVWLYRGVGQGSVTPEALELAQDAALSVVPGACPLMYLPDATWPHRMHASVQRLVGRYAR